MGSESSVVPSYRIVLLDRSAFPFDLKRPGFSHRWVEYRTTPQANVAERLRGATIAITNRVPVRRREIERLPELRMIAVAGTGYGQIDLAACRERGIVVSNLRGWCDCSVSEHVFALALALRRHLSEHAQTARDTTWHRSTTGALHCTHPARDLCGDTMGIIGFGNIGKRVAGLAKAFGMKVLAAERKGSASIRSGRIEFSRVLEQSDIVSLHCPLTDETRYLIGEDELRSMKRDAILINCANGELLDNTALSRALTGGTIGGAGLDDVEVETPANQLLNLRLPNFIVTPLVAWASNRAIEEFRQQLVDNLEAFAAGDPRNAITALKEGALDSWQCTLKSGDSSPDNTGA